MVQTQIRERRQNMVTEGRLKQKRVENQLKLEAKLHDLDVYKAFYYLFMENNCVLIASSLLNLANSERIL